MPETHLALLRSLALQPSRAVAENLEPIVMALQKLGYVTCGPEGWIATAAGCAMVQRRAVPYRAP
jgi:hypothetical protein